MQNKHAEVSRLTYARNISKCLQIHHGTFLESTDDIDIDEKQDDE